MQKDFFIIQDELASRFWSNVKSELLKTNHSYKELANYLKVDSAVLNSQTYLKGKSTLKITRAIKISSFFNRPLSYFFIKSADTVNNNKVLEIELNNDNGKKGNEPVSIFLLSLTKIQLQSVYSHILSFFDLSVENISNGNLSEEEDKYKKFNFSINDNEEKFLINFYENLKDLISKKNLTLNIIAKNIDLSQGTLYPQIRNNKDANIYPYIAICERYNFSIDYLAYGIGSLFCVTEVQKKYDEFVIPAREYIFNEAVKAYNRFSEKDYISLIIGFFPNLNDIQIKFIINHILSY